LAGPTERRQSSGRAPRSEIDFVEIRSAGRSGLAPTARGDSFPVAIGREQVQIVSDTQRKAKQLHGREGWSQAVRSDRGDSRPQDGRAKAMRRTGGTHDPAPSSRRPRLLFAAWVKTHPPCQRRAHRPLSVRVQTCRSRLVPLTGSR